jgi:hypothetical protein
MHCLRPWLICVHVVEGTDIYGVYDMTETGRFCRIRYPVRDLSELKGFGP